MIMPDETTPVSLSVVILGTDAVLAAAPATPVQLAHACLAAGYGAVVPASWGDELIATECLRRAATRGHEPLICAVCPRVTDRLLASGAELAPFAMALVSPPVATARYLRSMCGDDRVRITYIGACPGADDESLDARMLPHEFLRELSDRGIVTLEQPQVFDSVIPPDRRRFQSLPGGVPTPEALWSAGGRTLIEIDHEDYVTDIAQRLVNREHALLDVAPKLGCACSGAVDDVAPRSARIAVAAMEPPRSAMPVIDPSVAVDLVRSLPTASRRQEIVLPPALGVPPTAPPVPPTQARDEPEPRLAPKSVVPRRESRTPEGMAAVDPVAPRRRPNAASSGRAIAGAVPTVSNGEGRVLPRAYVARRRTGRTPPDNEAVRPDSPPPRTTERERAIESSIEPASAAIEPASASVAPPAPIPPVRESPNALAVTARAGLERVTREPLRLAVLIGVMIIASVLFGIVAGRRFAGTPGAAAPSADVQPADVQPADGLNGARSLSDDIPPNRVTERGGAVGPELRTPPASPPARRPAGSTRRVAPDAAARRAAAAPRVAAPVAAVPANQGAATAVDSSPPPAATPAAAPTATRQDSIDRELQSIARELEMRRARLDSIARRDSLRSRPPR